MRLYWRISALTLTLATLLTIVAAPAAAHERNPKDYLALGDSVAFGFNPLLDFGNAANFVGYPDVVARDAELKLTNASCPGEATGGFLALTGTDNGCRPYRAAFPLHVAYPTTETQLQFAIGFLKSHPRTRLVTIDIGANDLFVLQRQVCHFDVQCIRKGLPGLLQTVAMNLTTIFGRIRTEAGYNHQLVALTYYALNYSDPVGVPIVLALNNAIAQVTRAAHGQVADGFGVFQVATVATRGDSCAAGLLIQLPPPPAGPGGCDVHPTPKGRNLLATAIERVVNDPDDAHVP